MYHWVDTVGATHTRHTHTEPYPFVLFQQISLGKEFAPTMFVPAIKKNVLQNTRIACRYTRSDSRFRPPDAPLEQGRMGSSCSCCESKRAGYQDLRDSGYITAQPVYTISLVNSSVVEGYDAKIPNALIHIKQYLVDINAFSTVRKPASRRPIH